MSTGRFIPGSHGMAGFYPRGMVIVAGNSHRQLAEDIARRVGASLCQANIAKGTDKETKVEIMESVRGKDVFILQTGHPGEEEDSSSVNDSIMEMLITCYAAKTSSAKQVIGVMPYLPYCKHSKMRKRGCITAKLLANMMAKAGMSHLVTMDLYNKEIQGFFDFPVDNLRASPFLIQYIQEHIPDYRNAVVVARYPGVTRRATSFAERLRLNLAVIHGEVKQDENEDDRNSPPPPQEVDGEEPGLTMPPINRTPSKSATVVPKEKPPINVVGDVHGRIAIIIDDIVDEMDRLTAAANCLKECGAYKIYAVATHGLLSKDACEQLENSALDELLVTNTVPQKIHEQKCTKIKTIDVSLMFAEAIRRIYHGESMSYLFRNIPMED